MPSLSSAYEILGLPFGAPIAEVRSAYERLRHQDADDAGRNRALAEAFRTLTNPFPAPVDTQGPMPRKLPRLTGHLRSLLPGGAVRVLAEDRLELLLTAEEAQTGGTGMLSFETRIVCRTCKGARSQECDVCHGAGEERELVSFWFTVPARVAEGTVLEPSVAPLALVKPVRFVVRAPASKP